MTLDTKIESTAVRMESDSIASSHGHGNGTVDNGSVADGAPWSSKLPSNEKRGLKDGLLHYFPKYKLKRSGEYCCTQPAAVIIIIIIDH